MSYAISLMVIGVIPPRKISKADRDEAIEFLEAHADLAQRGDGIVTDDDPQLALEMLAALWHSEHLTSVGVEHESATVPSADVMRDFLECAALLREGFAPWDKLKKLAPPKTPRARKSKLSDHAPPTVCKLVESEPAVTDDPHAPAHAPAEVVDCGTFVTPSEIVEAATTVASSEMIKAPGAPLNADETMARIAENNPCLSGCHPRGGVGE